MKPLHRMAAQLTGGALTVLLVGCSSSTGTAEPVEPTITETTTQAPGTEEPAEPTDEPIEEPVEEVTSQEPCPYLASEFIADTVGQLVFDVYVTTTTPPVGPLPKCEFHGWGAEVTAIIDTLTIEEGTGLEQAIELVPDGNPASAGEGGSVLVHQGQDRTDLAAFSGTTMVIVTINQESSLEANALASAVFAALD